MKKFFSFVVMLAAALTVSATTFTKLTAAPEDWTGYYLVVYEASATQAKVFKGIDGSANYETATIAEGVITADNLDKYVIAIREMEGGYSLKMGTNYIGAPTNDNGVFTSLTPLLNTLTYENSAVTIGSNGRNLRFNKSSNSDRFRYFASAQQTVQLYQADETYDPDAPIKLDTVSVTQARARIEAKNLDACYVRGIVAKEPSDPLGYGNTIVWLRDIQNPNDSLEGYKIMGENNATFADYTEIPFILGDTILLAAPALAVYNGTNATTGEPYTIYETNGGNLAKIEGAIQRVEVPAEKLAAVWDIVEEDLLTITIADKDDNQLLAVEKDLKDGDKSANGTYDLKDVTIHMGGDLNLTCGMFKLIYDSQDAEAQRFSYHVRIAAIGADNKAYRFDDILMMESVDADGEPVLFEEDNNNIDVAAAVEIAGALASGKSSTYEYKIYGYCVGDADKGTFRDGKQAFYMSDDAEATSGAFIAYQVTTERAIEAGEFVCVTAVLKNFNGTSETDGGVAVVMDPADKPILRRGAALDTISADRAYEIGMALPLATETGQVISEKTYVVLGYCVSVSSSGAYNASKKTETWYMANTEGAYGKFQAYACTVDAEVVEGDKMAVIGKIMKYVGESKNGGTYTNIEISKGQAFHTEAVIPDDAQAVPQVMMERSHRNAVKLIDNGRVLILRNGVVYNAQGQLVE